MAIQGKANMSNSQSFNGLAVNPGVSAVALTSGTLNILLLSLGGITRSPGGTVDFILPAGAQTANNGITTTTPNNVAGILGGYATVSESDWASSAGTNGLAGDITVYNGYTNGDLGTLASNATLNLKPTGPQTAVTTTKSFNSLNLTGTVGVTISGSGSLTLKSGGLIGNTSGIITGGTLAGSTNGELIVITPVDLTIASTISATSLTKAGSRTLTLTGANGNAGTTLVANGTLLLSNSNAAQNQTVNVAVDNGLQFAGSIGTFNVGSIAGGGALALTDTGGSSVTVVAGGNNASTTYSGVISGAGTLEHSGSGTLVLAASNTFSGGLILESNQTVLGATGASGSGSITFDGTSTITVTVNMTIPNPFVSNNGATGTINTANYTVTLSGPISGTGGMNKTGGGTAVLTNSNSISGPTAVNQGKLQLGNSAALPNSTVGINPDNGLTFSSSIGTFNVGGLSGNGSLALADTAGVPVNIIVGGNNQNTTFGGAISGSGSLTKVGSGSIELTGNNSQWTGGLVIDPSVVAFNSDAAFGAPTNPITFIGGGGTLQASDSGDISLTAGRLITINAGATAAFDPQGNTLAIAGPITGGGTLAVTGSGTVVLSNLNTYSGGMFINGGALEATSSATLPGAFTPGKVRVGGGASLVLAVGGSQQWTAAGVNLLLSESGLFQPGASFGLETSDGSFDIGSINPGGIALAIPAGNTLDVGGNSDATYSGQITGSGSLTKIGSGIVVLTSTNDYRGGTEVLDGTLLFASESALRDGTDLTVGNQSPFAAIVPASVPASCGNDRLLSTLAAPVAVPEPGPQALVIAALVLFSAWQCHNKKRPCPSSRDQGKCSTSPGLFPPIAGH